MFAAADERSVPSTLALSSSSLVLLPFSHATACWFLSWIEPGGRSLSALQVTCGTLNWICAGRMATSAGLSFRNGSSCFIMAGSAAAVAGSWICEATVTAGPSFLTTASCWALRSGAAEPLAAAAAAEPLGAAEPDGAAVADDAGVGVGRGGALGGAGGV